MLIYITSCQNYSNKKRRVSSFFPDFLNLNNIFFSSTREDFDFSFFPAVFLSFFLFFILRYIFLTAFFPLSHSTPLFIFLLSLFFSLPSLIQYRNRVFPLLFIYHLFSRNIACYSFSLTDAQMENRSKTARHSGSGSSSSQTRPNVAKKTFMNDGGSPH